MAATTVAAGAGAVAGQVVRSKWFWIALVAIVVFLIVRRNWNRLSAAVAPDRGDYSNGRPADIPENRRYELERIARDIHVAMDDLNWSEWMTWDALGKRQALCKEALALSDGELKYMARYYRKSVNRGVKLSKTIDGEWISGEDDEKLVVELERIGE